jgi:tol-pal system protein YbgF
MFAQLPHQLGRMSRVRLRLLTAAALTFAVAAPVFAQPQPAPPVPENRRIRDLDRKVRELEQIVRQGAATGRPVVVAPETFSAEMDALRSRIEDLEATQRAQNGTIEALTADIAAARRAASESQARLVDLQSRTTALEARPVAAPEPGPEEADVGGEEAAAEPGPAFEAARRRLLEGDYAGAEAAFEAFVARYPEDAKALEARYWLGESRYVREDYAGAAEAYIAAIRPWPKTSWGPDAAVKLAGSLVELKRNTQACQLLSEMRRRYPRASDAVKTRAGRIGTRAACAA